MCVPRSSLLAHFNPRSHERSDSYNIKKGAQAYISIHAPTRGATCFPVMPFPLNLFQSTLPREERQTLYGTPTPEFTFQSTLPREERQITDTLICNLRWYFNPRSHERSDGKWHDKIACPHTISIHAPTRGATTTTRQDGRAPAFQSTLPREERQ